MSSRSSETVVMSLSEVGWTVYRVRTGSSQYHLAVFEGGDGRRRCAVLRGTSKALGRDLDIQDSAPLVAGKLLFDVPVAEWVGKQLEIGTATTSPIQSVEKEEDRAVVTSITSLAALGGGDGRDGIQTSVRPVPRHEEAQKSPYPEDYVEWVEMASNALRAAYQKKKLMDDLRTRPELHERFRVALGECLLVLQALGARMNQG